MTTPVNFRVKNGLTVANGVTVSAGNVVITDGQLVIGATAINSTSLSTSAENAYANGVNYADGKAADAYGNAVAVATGSSTNAYNNAVAFAANADNLTSGTLSLNRLPSTVNVAIALNVSDTVSLETGNVSVTNGNDVSSLTSSRLSFTDNLTETGNGFYVSVTHNELITSKTYEITGTTYSDYGQVSRTGLFAVQGLDTTNSSIYVKGVTVNTSVISIGNTSVYSAINSTAIVGNGSFLTSVNAATVGGNSASDLRTYSETLASNATYLTSGTVNSARLPAANNTVAGAVIIVDSTSNTSTTAAATAASVKSAYDAAIAANTAAGTLAGTAYSNAVTYADNKAANAYSNAIAIAANATNLTSGTVNIARIPTLDVVNNTSISYVATANSVKTAYDAAITANTNAQTALTAAGAAYTNAIAIAANATNLTSGTVNSARLPSGNSTTAGAVVLVDSVSNTSTTAAASAASVKTAYDAAITANTNATNLSANAYTNATTFAANATNISSGTLAFARLPTVDAVNNTSITLVPVANNVKTAYDAAIAANTRAASAQTAAASAYTNATSYADTAAGTAYVNAVAIAANATNLTSGTVNIARIPTLDVVNNTSISYVATANSVKTAYDAAITANTNAQTALTAAGAAYTNAAAYTDGKIATANAAITGNAATAYSNAVTYTDGKILTANAAITGNAATAYTNAVSYTDTKIGTANTAITGNAATAYTNAVSYVDTKIGTANTAMVANAAAAYTNATIFAANASNANNGTLSEARLPYRMNQDVRTTDTVTFGNITVTGNITVQGTTSTVNTVTLSVQDNLIYLNANNTTANPDLGFAGNYNDGTYHHAGFFRDATDGVWKVFDNYAPEPDDSPYIDTSNNTFRIAAFQANTVYIGNTSVYGTINSTAFTGTANNATYAFGKTEGAINANSALVANNSTYAFGKTEGAINANSALTANNADYLDGQHGSYYTNATNISTGTLPYAQIPANVINTTANFSVAGAWTFNANTTWGAADHIVLSSTSGISANGSYGTAGHVLHTNGTAVYWATDDQGVTSVATANGVGGGTITSTGSLYVVGGPTLTVNSTGAHVNSTLSITSLTLAGAASGITTLAAGNTTITGSITYSGSLTTTNTSLYSSATGSSIFGIGSAIVSANSQGGRVYEGSHDFNTYPNLYSTIFINTSTATNVPSGLSGNAYRFIMGAGDVAARGFDLVGTSSQLWFRSRESGNTAWYQAFTTAGGTITGATTLSANIVMANNNITNPVLTGYTEAEVSNTAVSGTWTMNCTAANFFDITLTGNTTISPSNVPPSTRMWAGTIAAKQDATGGRTITWPTGTKWPGGVAPPATTTANAIDIWSLMTYDGGTSWIASLTVKGAA